MDPAREPLDARSVTADMGRRWVCAAILTAMGLSGALAIDAAGEAQSAWRHAGPVDEEVERAMLSDTTRRPTLASRYRPGCTASPDSERPDEDEPRVIASEHVRGPETRFNVEGLPPITLRVVDAETGEPVAAPDPFGERWRANEYRRFTFVELLANGRIEVSPLRSWIAWDVVRWKRPVSEHAQEIEIVVPIRREVRVRVTVVDHNGGLATDAEFVSASIAGRHADVRWQEWQGEYWITEGVPYFRGERLVVTVVTADGSTFASGSTLLSRDPDSLAEVSIQLPQPSAENDTRAPVESDLWNFPGPPSGSRIGGGRAPALGRGMQRHVVVVDENGDPLPFARIHWPERSAWIDEHDGVHRLDRFTDHDGRRTLSRMSRYVKEVTVTWGSRSASVDIGEGATGTLRIVLPRKDP